MKKVLTIFTAILSALFIIVLASCGQTEKKITGALIEKELETHEISKIEIYDINLSGTVKEKTSKSQVKVNIKNSDTKSINFSLQESLLDEISIDFDDDKLIVSADSDITYITDNDLIITITGYVFNDLSFTNSIYAKIEEGTVNLDEAIFYLDAYTTLEVDKIETKELYIGCHNSSIISVQNIHSDNYANYEIDNSSTLKIKNSKYNKLRLYVENRSNVEIEGLKANFIDAFIENSSNIDIIGNSNKLNLELISSSNLKGYEFEVGFITLILSQNSTLQITATESITGDVSGLSFVECKGNPNETNITLHDGSDFVNYTK